MSARRQARATAAVPLVRGIPEALLSRAHPLWQDADAAAEVFSEYVTPTDRGPLEDRRLHSVVLFRWCTQNGVLNEYDRPDLGRLRQAAGVDR